MTAPAERPDGSPDGAPDGAPGRRRPTRATTAEDLERDPATGVRKARDAVLVVPLVGLVLLMPPIAQAFAIEGRILGIPVTLGYIFGVWLVLIVLARRAGRRILETETSSDGGVGLG